MSRHHRKRSAMAGFSLVEVLVALVILGVGLMGLARLQLGMLGSTAESVLHDSAIRLAEDKLEALRFEFSLGKMPVAGSDQSVAHDVIMQRRWSLTESGSSTVDTVISLQWREPRTGEEHTLALPAKLQLVTLAAQGWLIQSGLPAREPLP